MPVLLSNAVVRSVLYLAWGCTTLVYIAQFGYVIESPPTIPSAREQQRVIDFYKKNHSVENIPLLLNPSRHVCNTDFLAIVHSAAWHFENRNWIRATWANRTLFPAHELRVVFALSKPTGKYSGIEKQIQEESRQHGDILYLDVAEDYFNITYKAIAAFQFVDSCPKVKYIIKTDDDTVTNTFAVIRHARKLNHRENAIVCVHRQKYTPFRDTSIKWFVTYDEYPLKRYPRYCQGGGLFLTKGMSQLILTNIPITPYFKIDDVYLYGMTVKFHRDIRWIITPWIYTFTDAQKYLKSGQHFEFIFQNEEREQFFYLWKEILAKERISNL